MPSQNRNSQSSQTSGGGITGTPVLTASSSSAGDSPLVSPLSAHFSGISDSPLSKQPTLSGEAQVYFEEHPEAWWGRRTSVDSSSSTNPPDFRPHGLLKLRTPRDILGAAHRAPDLQFGRYVDSHSEGSPNRPVDQENKQSISSLPSTRDATSELPPTPTQATPTGAPTEPSQAHKLPTRPSELPRPSSNSCLTEHSSLDLNVIPPSPKEMHRTRRSSFPVLSRPIPRHGLVTGLSRAGTLSDTSRPESSVLAHCDQPSLSPPSETLTQTQCGRLALHEAGIPYGSPKALAPSMPVENLPPRDPRRQTSQFLQRLVRKTFTRSQATLPQAPATAHSPLRDSSTTRTRVPARVRSARYSMSFSFARADVSPPIKKDDPNPPKKSRWAVVQRFIAKPGAAAKAASDASAPVQPHHIRRLSSVSFLGDAMTRVDPFARAGGLGATVSDPATLGQFGYSVTHAPRRLSMATGVSAHMFERFSHVVSFPSGDDSAASRAHTEESVSEFQTPTTDRMNHRDSDVDIVGSDRSGSIHSQDFADRPDGDPKYLWGRPATSRAERRHSSPLLGMASRPGRVTSRASMSRL